MYILSDETVLFLLSLPMLHGKHSERPCERLAKTAFFGLVFMPLKF
jgi:hypothetical protein